MLSLAAVVATLGAAAAFAVGSALQQRAAKQETPSPPLDPRLILRLMRRPAWLAGWIPEAIGTGLQALALRYGPLVLVEPLLVSGLFLAIPVEAALGRHPLHSRDFAVVTLGAAGLASFLIAAQPRPGLSEPSVTGWLGVALWASPALAVCLAFGWHATNATRGVVLGVATGLLYGISASLLKTLTAQLATDPLSVLARGQLYALVAVGLSAVILNQNAFQDGRLAVPLTAITITDPTVSVAIGVTAFHEKIATDGPRLAIELAAAAAMAGAIWLASTARSDSERGGTGTGPIGPPHRE